MGYLLEDPQVRGGMMLNIKYDFVYFIADNSIQTSLLKDSLQKGCKYLIEKKKIQGFIDKLKTHKGDELLVIIDLDYFNDEYLQQYIQAIQEYQVQSYEVLINVDANVEVDDLVKFPKIRGVFYRDDSLEQINNGIKHVQDGCYWFSRDLSHRLIEFYRNQEIYIPKMVVNLTTREEQVLRLLLIGASNQQIATSLFVSENTVKSHLHNVFKKLKVKNRLQALMWAKKQSCLRNFQ